MSFLFKKIKASLKGKRGETYTNLLTAFTAVGKRSVNYKDVYISWPNNRTVQIDELLIARSGIYVVEVKNFKGWILGNMKNDHWTQCLYRKRSFFFSKSNKYKFYNPIKQNQGHINCLKYILSEYPDIPYHSIVVFSNDAVFKNIKYDKNKVYTKTMS